MPDNIVPGDMKRLQLVGRIVDERYRQIILLAAGKIKIACESPETDNGFRLAVLAEEFGEVAKEVCEELQKGRTPERTAALKTELIQTAAVCLAWLEGLEE